MSEDMPCVCDSTACLLEVNPTEGYYILMCNECRRVFKTTIELKPLAE